MKRCIACVTLDKAKKSGKGAGFDLDAKALKTMCNDHKRAYRNDVPKKGSASYIYYQVKI